MLHFVDGKSFQLRGQEYFADQIIGCSRLRTAMGGRQAGGEVFAEAQFSDLWSNFACQVQAQEICFLHEDGDVVRSMVLPVKRHNFVLNGSLRCSALGG